MESEQLLPKGEVNSIKLIRGQRGGYGWEVKLIGADEKDIINRLNLIDKELQKTYTEVNLKEVK